MAKYDYNIIVIGTGSGELSSSYTASAIKANVALIEKHKIGGDCLNSSITLPDKKDLDYHKIKRFLWRLSNLDSAND